MGNRYQTESLSSEVAELMTRTNETLFSKPSDLPIDLPEYPVLHENKKSITPAGQGGPLLHVTSYSASSCNVT
jgi:hypothetical protein